ANSLMGAFLYFADTLPAAYKFVSKLLFLPGGDRDRGLEMMELAVGYNSLVERDNRLVLYSVYIGFEGRYEEGLQGFEVLCREDPFHSTFVRPAVMLTVLKPRYTEAVGLELDGRVAVIDSLPGDETDQATYSLLHFFRGYADRFYYPERAHERLERMVEVNPDHPDWVTGYATFELGRMHAARGNVEEANRLFLGVINNERAGYLHADARSMIRALTKSPAPTAPVDSVIVGIYAGEEGAVRAVEHFRGLAEPSATDFFYLGEALLATGDDDGALDAYIGALDADAPLWDEEFQLMAATRAGELTGALGDYAIAAGYYKAARRLWTGGAMRLYCSMS
ncbi:MAG: hypothetical protein IH969_02700, partial [Candidatus Krumholzibacteriota bacterium]|nr:hypothetical protein [Candidatus Krumholzibacteriota bacterium]